MKILHYTVGFPPARTGGLVTYVKQLLGQQAQLGHQVSVLYPGNQLFFGKKIAIDFKGLTENISYFELVNSLPMALFGGILDPEKFMIAIDDDCYRKFLSEQNIQLIHVHTLIGLHKEFMEVARELGIPIVFTTHDYYGLAPLPNFFYNKHSYHNESDNHSWNIMSHDALPVWKLRLFQHRFYPTIRFILKKLNRNPKHASPVDPTEIAETLDYSGLRQYYTDMFSLVDFFHFNSKVAERIYRQYLGEIQGQIVRMTISTDKIVESSLFIEKVDTIAYIGPDEPYKGYFDFLDLANKLKSDYQFVTYGHLPNQFAPDFVEQRGRYTQAQLSTIYEGIDLLIVPSRWQETFGLVVLEALAQGVPVLASSNLGASECLPERFIFSSVDDIPGSLDELIRIKDFGTIKIPSFADHVNELTTLYGELTYEG